MRVAIHTQHFAGVGHHVRTSRLARAFRQAKGEVLVFDGGRPFHQAGGTPFPEVDRVQLPPLAWGSDGLEPCGGTQPLSAVLAARSQLLVAGLRRFRPDLFLLDSFPFSRWALRAEILAGIRQLKADNSAVRVVCSLRDVPRASQLSRAPDPHGQGADHRRTWPIRPGDDGLEQVPELLDAHFDAIVVHGDPRVARIEEQFPWSARLRIPVRYTGYVQEEAPASGLSRVVPAKRPLVVVSVGGGVNGLPLIELVTAAWSQLRQRPGWNGGQMVVFGGALMSAADLASASASCDRHGAQFEAFSHDFASWLQAADLSISRGGYNTMVALLVARVRGLVFPGTDVSDQAVRVRRLAELGIVSTWPEGELDPARLAARIITVLGRPAPRHDLDLDGAGRTVQLLTALVNDRQRPRRRPSPAPAGRTRDPLSA